MICTCVICNKTFKTSRGPAKVCSNVCRQKRYVRGYAANKDKIAAAYRAKKVKKFCVTCGDVLPPKAKKWCSDKCHPADGQTKYSNPEWAKANIIKKFPQIESDLNELVAAFENHRRNLTDSFCDTAE